MLAALNPVWSAVSAFIALIGALGIAYAIFTSARVTKTIELYEVENKALGQSVTRQTSDIAVLQDRVSSLENENRVLRNVVTGKTAVEELAVDVKKEEAARRAEHAGMDLKLSALEVLLKDVLGQLKDIARYFGRERNPGSGEIGR